MAATPLVRLGDPRGAMESSRALMFKIEGLPIVVRRSSRDNLEEALGRIATPAGEGGRACLDIYVDAARTAADASDSRSQAGGSLGPLDGVIVTIKDLFDVAGETT